MREETVLENTGPQWPGWEITVRIGGGGFGTVYEIQRTVAGKTEKAAMKVISIPDGPDEMNRLYSEGYNSDSISAHFKECLDATVREYSLVVDLKGHPNVVRSEDIRYEQHSDGIGWDVLIRMERLDPLTTFFGNVYDETQTIRLAKDICNALIACEQKGIMHRDIKPGNILVTPEGNFKLGDFGIARVSEQTSGKTVAGSYDYMAPEVYHGKAYGHRADLYSLGLVLYWLMNNKKGPFVPQGESVPTLSMVESARKRRFGGEALPDPLNGSEGLKKIVQKACAFDPRYRYSSAAEMKEALEQLTTNSPSPPPLWKKIALIGGGALAAVGLLFALGGREKDPCEAGHTWTAGSCVSSQTCEICGIENGVVPGHQWATATCERPKTCELCGETEGAALGHVWTAATCIHPETCSACGATSGNALGHNWKEATYAAPKTCSTCGATEGSRLVADPVYLNELGVSYHEGKMWTRGQTAPSGSYHTNSDARSDSPNASICWSNWRTPGHTLGPVKDQAGNQYTYGIFIDGSKSQDYYMEFDLGGKYTTFSGICACPERDSAISRYVYYNASTLYSKYFEVYLDGEYIGSSPSMRADYRPQEFEFDVTGGQTLKIVYPATDGPNEIASIYDGMLK